MLSRCRPPTQPRAPPPSAARTRGQRLARKLAFIAERPAPPVVLLTSPSRQAYGQPNQASHKQSPARQHVTAVRQSSKSVLSRVLRFPSLQLTKYAKPPRFLPSQPRLQTKFPSVLDLLPRSHLHHKKPRTQEKRHHGGGGELQVSNLCLLHTCFSTCA